MDYFERLREADMACFSAKFNARINLRDVVQCFMGQFAPCGEMYIPHHERMDWHVLIYLRELRDQEQSKNRHVFSKFETSIVSAYDHDLLVEGPFIQSIEFMQDGSMKSYRSSFVPICEKVESHLIQKVIGASLGRNLSSRPTLRDCRITYSGFEIPGWDTSSAIFSSEKFQRYFSDDFIERLGHGLRACGVNIRDKIKVTRSKSTNKSLVVKLGEKNGSILIQNSGVCQVMSVKSLNVFDVFFPYLLEAVYALNNNNNNSGMNWSGVLFCALRDARPRQREIRIRSKNTFPPPFPVRGQLALAAAAAVEGGEEQQGEEQQPQKKKRGRKPSSKAQQPKTKKASKKTKKRTYDDDDDEDDEDYSDSDSDSYDDDEDQGRGGKKKKRNNEDKEWRPKCEKRRPSTARTSPSTPPPPPPRSSTVAAPSARKSLPNTHRASKRLPILSDMLQAQDDEELEDPMEEDENETEDEQDEGEEKSSVSDSPPAAEINQDNFPSARVGEYHHYEDEFERRMSLFPSHNVISAF